jgi:uncharacterized protein (DUF2147 family)
MKRAIFVAIIGATLAVASAYAQSVPTAKGLWEETDDQGNVNAWFFFSEKDGLYSGRIVKIFNKPGDPVYPLCVKCPGELKNARMLGLTLVSGMKRDGLNYTGGSILDPRDGTIYHAEMSLSPDGQKLSVRGYIGIPLLGQTQVWNRLPDDTMPPKEIPKEVLAAPADKS